MKEKSKEGMTMRVKRWMCLMMAMLIMAAVPAGAMAAQKAAIKLPAKVGLLFVEGQMQLKPKLKGVKSEDLTYATSADGVVEISEKGVIKGVAQGKVTVTVSGGGAKAKCAILVVPKGLSLEVGEKVTLPTATDVKFKMKDIKIAKVTQKGVVKGVKAGKTKLLMVCGKQKRTLTVEVRDKGGETDGDSKAAKLAAAAETDQIVLVEYKSGSKATLSVHEKQDGHWKQLLETPAYVGKNGIDKTKEGDKRTPTGTFNLTTPFGIKADPGAKMTYTKVTKYHYWCGSSDSDYYNKLVDYRDTKRKWTKSDEHLIDYKGYYNYAMFIDYNVEGVKDKGSCVFLHCTGKKKSTMGCVAVSEASMKKIIQWAKPGVKIVIQGT
ncbi:MAG: L,D-transpeptidase family protein [Clostridia bacterium]|nr:L,D-transpeptidase family protein [Clostridia bacterium]